MLYEVITDLELAMDGVDHLPENAALLGLRLGIQTLDLFGQGLLLVIPAGAASCPQNPLSPCE